MLQELKQFFLRNWWNLILIIPGAYFITFLHELAHAIPVWAQGGTVTEFIWYGDKEGWGHINYSFPKNIDYNDTIISLGPYISAIIIFFIGNLISRIIRNKYAVLSSLTFVWLIVIPLAELAYGLFPYCIYNTDNDIFHAFGKANSSIIICTIFATVFSTISAYFAHENLYHSQSLSPKTFFAVSLLPITIIAIF